MNKGHVKKIVLSALFAAFTFVATLIHVHVPGMVTGYVNLGDSLVIASGLLLGPIYGGLAAGVGSALADFLHGYLIYVPGTFVIKMLVAVAAYYLFNALSGKKREYKIWIVSVSGAVAEIIMVLGYFFYEGAIIPGIGYAGAALGIVGNCVQAVFGVIVSVLVLRVMKKSKLTDMIED